MCEELEISRDSYYKWLKRKDTKNKYELNHDSLKPLIQEYYDLSNGTAGYRQIKEQLKEHINEEVKLEEEESKSEKKNEEKKKSLGEAIK